MNELEKTKPNPPADELVKSNVINLVKAGSSVAEAAHQSGYSTKTIYSWIRASVESTGTSTNYVLENNRLKKELEQVYALLGRANALISRSKK